MKNCILFQSLRLLRASIVIVFLFVAGFKPLCADVLISSPDIQIATNLSAADSDTDTPGRPAVGFDGTNYLVVTCRNAETPIGLVGTIVSSHGTVLHEFFIGASVGLYPNERPIPAVNFDGTNYLVVFNRDSMIYGLRISPNGQLLDAPGGFLISTGDSEYATNHGPSLSFDGQNFLVVWAKYQFGTSEGSDLYGARVSPGGEALGEFLVVGAPRYQLSPQVVFDGVNHLVVWEHSQSLSYVDADIYGTRVTPAGAVISPEGFPISSATNYQGAPHLAFDGTNSLVIWLDQRNYEPDYYHFDIYGARVGTNGVVLDGEGIAINTHVTEYKNDPRVCFDGKTFFITWWVAQYGSEGGSFAARVSSAGALLDQVATARGNHLKAPDCYACQVVHPIPVSNGKSVLVSWGDNQGFGYKHIRANFVTTTTNLGEMFWQNTNGTVVSWFLQQTNFLGASVIAQRLPEWRLMGQPDLDGDGHKDLLWQHKDGRLTFWRMNGTQMIGSAVLRSVNPKWIVAGTGHFNDDHSPDIVFRNSDGVSAVWFMNYTNFLSASLIQGGVAVGTEWKLRLVGDMDDNGSSDLLWQNTDGRLVLWSMNQVSLVKSTALPKIGKQWIAAGLSDFNLDGKNDILFQNLDRRSAVWFMNGTNFISAAALRNGFALRPGWRITGQK